jgi:hypothetical protein
MLDPILRLALAIHSSKGVYALLLGSGVSRSSAIPTGWEVVLDLIRKLAHAKGESCDPDPEAWYKALTGSDPDYSDILDQLTLSSAERGQLLRAYFEPTEEDREQGRKAPSPAHRTIAALVAKGYVRVIVTTNFDRLIEQALSEAGVQPTVISTVDAVHGAMPLTHSPCTVIKVHGDYLDSRLRNTRPELSAYERPFDDLLNRVFDEFGIVVCGWSAEWDVALRGAIERCATRRFGTYWGARHGQVTGEAEKLIAVRRAIVVPITDADAFFRDLAEKIRGLEDLTVSDPISARVAVARLKRYLADPQQHINLHDLVSAETERVYAGVKSARFSTNDNDLTPESVLRRLRAYEAELQTLIAIVASGSYWATEESHIRSIGGAVKRMGDDAAPKGGLTVWVSLKKYPALLVLYVAGIAAVANRKYSFLRHLFSLKIRTDQHQPEKSITEASTAWEAMDHRDQKRLLAGREQQFTPLNNHLFEALRLPLQEYTPDEDSFDRAFDEFEYLLGLAYCNATTSDEELNKADGSDGDIWGPVGRFAWNQRHSEDHIQKRMQFSPDGPYPEMVDGLIQAGMFGSHERLRLIKAGFDLFVANLRRQMHLW